MPDQHKVLFTADLHGNIAQYTAMLEIAKQEGIQSIIIGGDITPTDEGINPAKQRVFLEDTLPALIRKSDTIIPLYLMFGNDDAACNNDVLENYNGTLWFTIEGKRSTIAPSRHIVGYPYIPLAPFAIKDYEKFDRKPVQPTALLKKIFRESPVAPNAVLRGYRSCGAGLIEEVVFDKSNITDTIEEDLKSAHMTFSPRETIYVFHSPPYNTRLDLLPHMQHVGSKAIRQFIETQRPLLVLSGHIHETVDVSGTFVDSINGSICATAGNRHESGIFSYLTFDAYAPQRTLKRKNVRM